MRVDIVTIFPEMLSGVLEHSILKRAQEKGALEVHPVDLRAYTTDRHRTTDDSPFGGGAGMVMKPEPLFAAVEDLRGRVAGGGGKVILTSPRGEVYNQAKAAKLSQERHLILLCGRYEGVDERVRQSLVDEEISLGDFVLTGGELAALVVLDSVARLLPGVLGHEESSEFESFSDGLLEYPHYTRPADFGGMCVPEVLLGGNHAEIERWRRERSLQETLERRPDLLESAPLYERDRQYLKHLRRNLAG
ncbi:MAG TPA: tRNA (guanosine(37)-N1)-methyltransferase TrmD [Armatimonadota bacterium]|jgi:tRNA (guanine37-N1)-methyltransferase